MITLPQIKAGAPWITQERLSKYGPFLIDAMVKNHIDTPARISAFLAQVVHESGEFKFVAENLNYSAAGLKKTFPKYFPNDRVANHYDHDAQAIANKVYANRMGNGNEASGDGWKYKGRGLIQLTGYDNYSAITIDLNVDFVKYPELLEQPKYAAESAVWFWNKHELNDMADLNTMESFKSITRVINGGLNGIEQRTTYWIAYKHELGI